MPRVKIDYIISFSSEDSNNPASNLLQWDISNKKWLCAKGEQSCSVVLQLAKAVKISAVEIGAHYAAMVEVLVGRSETPSEPQETLVPSCVLLSPSESRRGERVSRVRSFAAGSLGAAAAQRWDRVRVVCQQPYVRDCQFGLSFIHIFEPEAPSASTTPAPSLAPTLSLATLSSDEEEFTPGSLFAAARARLPPPTDAQIRQASLQAINNTPDSLIKLNKTFTPKVRKDESINSTKEASKRDSKKNDPSQHHTSKKNDSQKDQTRKDDSSRDDTGNSDQRKDNSRVNKLQNDNSQNNYKRTDKPQKDESRTVDVNKTDRNRAGPSEEGESVANQRQTLSPKQEALCNRNGASSNTKEASSSRPEASAVTQKTSSRRALLRDEEILSDVHFVLSGYENPRRSQIRELACALGAVCHRDWGPRCTHLFCAFPNTPKLRSVQRSRNGAAAVIVKGEWVEACARRHKLVSARKYLTVGGGSTHSSDSEEDAQTLRPKKRRLIESPPPSPPPPGVPPPPDTEPDTDEGGVTEVPDESTDEELHDLTPLVRCNALPALLDGHAVAIPRDNALAARYIRAYGGEVLSDESEQSADATRARGAWLWRAHRDRALPPVGAYRAT